MSAATTERTSPSRPGTRTASLPAGRTLVVRPVIHDDVDGLAALYAGLDDDARYRRFFSIYRPDRDFFERMTTIEERGGAGLVAAVIEDPDREACIVGEASYELLPDGNGELAITVDRSWRGWLGPYLLDALLEAAAAAGIENLEADVLTTNRPMLALIRSRGHVLLPTGDWTFVRALFGTATDMPTWGARPRRLKVLIEGTSGQWHAAEVAEHAGLDVLECPGPGRNDRCPALAGEACPLVAGADVVVLAHPLDDPAWDALRAAHPEVHPGVPVCIEIGTTACRARPREIVVAAEGEDDVVEVLQRVARQATEPRP